MLEGVEFKVGEPGLPQDDLPVLEIFDERVIDLLGDLSSAILADAGLRRYPDLVSFAFWSRKAALGREATGYRCDDDLSLGRGLAFHVAPGNVPLMFAYSLVMGLASGNANVVRLPSKDYWQSDLLCDRLDTLLRSDRHVALAPYVRCVRYDHGASSATSELSSACDVRLIWGGDATIDRVRREPLKPGAFDLVFFDRYSLAILDSDAWLAANDKPRLIHGFYNDTYLTDQLACSSPRYVLWKGRRVQEARTDFWATLEAEVEARYALQDGLAVRKWERFCMLGSEHPGLRLESHDNRIVRIWSHEVRAGLVEEHPGGGLFVESAIESLDDCAPLLGRGCQTLSYYGVSPADLRDLLARLRPRGVDRVTPIGQTLDFSLVWDGYDSVRALSRRIRVA